MKSVWQESALPQFPRLDGDLKTDVLIVGGGIAGVLTAYFLQQNGIKYALVEKGRICGGNTANTTAKITVQHGLIYQKILRHSGLEAAKKYLEANSAALNEYAALCKELDCDFEHKDSFVYSDSRAKLELEMLALQKLGLKAELSDSIPLPVECAGAVKLPGQAQFNPLKFIAGIADGLNIFENSFVREIDGSTAVTDSGKIVADKIICATHFPFINSRGAYFLKQYQHRSYVIALENAADYGAMYVDDSDAGLSFRNYKNLLLLGGGGSRTGKKNGGWELLRDFAEKHYPNAVEKYHWAAQDCMSLDGIAYIGRYAQSTPKLFVETGFNKWGMTSSMLSAMLITDMIKGRPSEFAELFNPSRSILKPQLAVNAAVAIGNFILPSKRVCSHLGCSLKWNSAEHSWDCPCHGSRFEKSGRILDNPANSDL